VHGESHNLTLAQWRCLHFPLEEALPRRDWVQGPVRSCIQSGTPILSGAFASVFLLLFCANAVAERELPVPI
jgi:hypothetical protein